MIKQITAPLLFVSMATSQITFAGESQEGHNQSDYYKTICASWETSSTQAPCLENSSNPLLINSLRVSDGNRVPPKAPVSKPEDSDESDREET